MIILSIITLIGSLQLKVKATETTEKETETLEGQIEISYEKKGDLDGDEDIDVQDAVLLLTVVANVQADKIDLSPEQWEKLNINGDGKLDAKDGQWILIYYAKQAAGQFNGMDEDERWEKVREDADGVDASENEIENKKLVDEVEIGDYVNYDANSGLTTPVTYTPEAGKTGYTEEVEKENNKGKQSTYSSADTMKWRVLNINKDTGTVELIAENTVSDLYLYGIDGYMNAETVLNDIGAVYGHGKGATGGRSISMEDINSYANFDPSRWGGLTKSYTSGTFIKTEEVTGGTEDKTDNRLVIASESNPVQVKESYYNYSAEKYLDETLFNLIYKEEFFASRCISVGTGNTPPVYGMLGYYGEKWSSASDSGSSISCGMLFRYWKWKWNLYVARSFTYSFSKKQYSNKWKR